MTATSPDSPTWSTGWNLPPKRSTRPSRIPQNVTAWLSSPGSRVAAEMDARLAMRTLEERARALAGRADALRRAAEVNVSHGFARSRAASECGARGAYGGCRSCRSDVLGAASRTSSLWAARERSLTRMRTRRGRGRVERRSGIRTLPDSRLRVIGRCSPSRRSCEGRAADEGRCTGRAGDGRARPGGWRAVDSPSTVRTSLCRCSLRSSDAPASGVS